MDALRQAGGNQTAAANILGVSRKTIRRKLDKYNINLNEIL
jgi:DNA-binding protein Fis